MKRIQYEIAVGTFHGDRLSLLCLDWPSASGNVNILQSSQISSYGPLRFGRRPEAGSDRGNRRRAGRPRLKRHYLSNQEYYEAIVHMSDRQRCPDLRKTVSPRFEPRASSGKNTSAFLPAAHLNILQPGGKIAETESAISLEELISKYIFQENRETF